MDCFDHGVRANICQHTQIDDLLKHSRLVNFVVKLQGSFMYDFAKHKDLFPGVHGKAMFEGTVLHSLDHTLVMDWNLEDLLRLDVNDPRFGIMVQIGRIVKVGFVKDVPLLYFHKRFKGSGHPFYEAVYRKAARIDKELADNVDTWVAIEITVGVCWHRSIFLEQRLPKKITTSVPSDFYAKCQHLNGIRSFFV